MKRGRWTAILCVSASLLGIGCTTDAAAGFLIPKNRSGVEVHPFDGEIVNIGVAIGCEGTESVKLLTADVGKVSGPIEVISVSLVRPRRPRVGGIGSSYGDVETQNPGDYDIVPVAETTLTCGKTEWQILLVLRASAEGRHTLRGVEVGYEALGRAREQRIDFEAIVDAKRCPRPPCSSIPPGGYSPRPS